MTVRKLSISVPPGVAEAITAAAAQAGLSVSAWVVTAATRQMEETAGQAEGRAAALELVAAYESEHGPLPDESRRRARMALSELGVLDDSDRARSPVTG